jgi:hypothetical protein
MIERKVLASAIGVLMLSLMALLVGSPRALASSSTVTIYLKPSDYVFSPENASIGTRFNVTVWVESDTYPFKLMTWEVFLSFNGSLISPVFYHSETWGETLPLVWPNDDMGGRNFDTNYVFYGKTGGITPKACYYPDLNAVMLGDTLFADIDVDAPKILCVIEFNVTAVPSDGFLSCALSIDNEDTFLNDKNGRIPSVVKVNGTYTFIPEFSMIIIPAMLLSTSIVTVIAKKKSTKKVLNAIEK